MSDDDKLDRIATILLLAFDEQISAARERFRADPVNAAILDATADWIGTTELQRVVADKASVSARTVRTRLSELREKKVLVSEGQGNQIQYKSAGIL